MSLKVRHCLVRRLRKCGRPLKKKSPWDKRASRPAAQPPLHIFTCSRVSPWIPVFFLFATTRSPQSFEVLSLKMHILSSDCVFSLRKKLSPLPEARSEGASPAPSPKSSTSALFSYPFLSGPFECNTKTPVHLQRPPETHLKPCSEERKPRTWRSSDFNENGVRFPSSIIGYADFT